LIEDLIPHNAREARKPGAKQYLPDFPD